MGGMFRIAVAIVTLLLCLAWCVVLAGRAMLVLIVDAVNGDPESRLFLAVLSFIIALGAAVWAGAFLLEVVS